jgi:hypothetical protein
MRTTGKHAEWLKKDLLTEQADFTTEPRSRGSGKQTRYRWRLYLQNRSSLTALLML